MTAPPAGDDGDGGDNNDGSPLPSPSLAPNANKKKENKKAPGGGGGGGDDNPDKDSDDCDEKFVRRMKKFLGVASTPVVLMINPKSRKQTPFPVPETYRNWRIKTRETIGAATTNPDFAFAWIGEVWKQGQTY